MNDMLVTYYGKLDRIRIRLDRADRARQRVKNEPIRSGADRCFASPAVQRKQHNLHRTGHIQICKQGTVGSQSVA